jgi:hypothetical protein
MQVSSLGYNFPRVLVVICTKFGEDSMIDPRYIDIVACNISQDQTYPVLGRTCLDRLGDIRFFLVCIALDNVN